MLGKIKNTAVIVLAMLGVLFMIILLIPDDEEPKPETVAVETEASEPESIEAETSEPEASEPESMAVETEETFIDSIYFQSTTLEGEKITSDIFSDYDITLVHIWGTYCGPCIREMGDYAAFYKEKPDNVNLIGVVIDTYDGLDNNVSYAEDILGDAGAEFMNIKISDSNFSIIEEYRSIPSSFFVDRKGHIVAKLDGAGFGTTMKELKKLL